MMVLLLAGVVYSCYAYLPFLNPSAKTHYAAAAAFAILGAGLWVTLARSVPKESLALYGIYFDAVLTCSFLIVPLAVNGFTLTFWQGIGIACVLVGLVLTKI